MLLKWVVTVYDLIDSKDKIANMYGILFHFLDSELLRYEASSLYINDEGTTNSCNRPGICHLLYYLTRRVHVKSYRIRQL
jgi:centromere protein I